MQDDILSTKKQIADLLFPNIANGVEHDRNYFETERLKLLEIRKFDVRMSTGYETLRVAPSPTGFPHIGLVYMALISSKIAKQTNGTFCLRIEDTDSLREMEGAREIIIDTLSDYNIKYDEYYVQSERVDQYKAFAFEMVKLGHAYPCFITKEELDGLREIQNANKIRPGIYGKYATNRNLSFEEIQNKLISGEKFVLRMMASGNIENKNKFIDEFLGEHMIPENDEDFVLLKSDGIPTYHFAHVVDDYLLGTTFVTRAEEWWSSLPKHLALWDALKLNRPKYGHIMPINKTEQKTLEDGSIKNIVRKLSKRKDPEASMSFYREQGYLSEAVTAYLYRLANPNFDEWFTENVSDKKREALKIDDYVLNMDEMKRGSRGPLLDFVKLNNISSDIVANMSFVDIAQKVLTWSKTNDIDFYNVISKDVLFLERVLNIERNTENPRKDIYKWSVAKENIFYFFDELFEAEKMIGENLTDEEKDVIKVFANKIEEKGWDDCMISLEVWMNKMKEIHTEIISENEKYKDKKFGAIMMLLRKSITKREKTPNLYFIFQALGKNTVLSRLNL